MKSLKLLFPLICLLGFAPGLRAELQDQGLNSVMQIIDKAITQVNAAPAEGEASNEAARENATNTVINMSRTLGTLSYSRLQCGEAGVLAEFTQRVQLMPEDSRDPMRDAFQEGFDKSKEETELLSQDECERLTRSRQRSEKVEEANVTEGKKGNTAKAPVVEEVKEVVPAEDPKLRHLRIAELSGQLAYRRKFCEDEKVFNRDYNEYLESIPQEYREEVKTAYWKGYKRGTRLNKGLTRDKCPA